MATPSPSPPTAAATAGWIPMHFHVRTYLAGHPLLHGFDVRTTAADEEITAELRYHTSALRCSRRESGWWRPSTPQHGRELADQIARDLYAQWMGHLRHR